jgi:hypothetical protein
MRVDATAAYIGMGIVFALSGGLFVTRKRMLQLFAAFLFFFLLLEITLVAIPLPFDSARAIWWTVHLPSTAVLGFDEILERHGIFISIIGYLADFIFWSALLSIPMSVKLHLEKKEKIQKAQEQKSISCP